MTSPARVCVLFTLALPLLSAVAISGSALAQGSWRVASSKGVGNSFALETLPPGADVTLPGPATTLVSLSSRVTLSSTDTPQTLSFTSINQSGGGAALPLRLAIYDRNQERVKYVELNPGTPFLYSFKTLTTISVIPEMGRGGASAKAADIKLQVESDKPLTIAR